MISCIIIRWKIYSNENLKLIKVNKWTFQRLENSDVPVRFAGGGDISHCKHEKSMVKKYSVRYCIQIHF